MSTNRAVISIDDNVDDYDDDDDDDDDKATNEGQHQQPNDERQRHTQSHKEHELSRQIGDWGQTETNGADEGGGADDLKWERVYDNERHERLEFVDMTLCFVVNLFVLLSFAFWIVHNMKFALNTRANACVRLLIRAMLGIKPHWLLRCCVPTLNSRIRMYLCMQATHVSLWWTSINNWVLLPFVLALSL